MSTPSERATLKRAPHRGSYDRETINSILDESLICYLAFTTPNGPVAMPTNYARIGDVLYFHGAHTSRKLRMTIDEEVCVTVAIVDGIVAARSAYNHSMNYRSVMMFGRPRIIEDPDERRAALEAIVEHVLPGRSAEVREPSVKEDRGTRILAIDIDEVSAKIRSGPPSDEGEDMDSGVWAGVIPLSVTPGQPINAPDLEDGIELSPSVLNYSPSS